MTFKSKINLDSKTGTRKLVQILPAAGACEKANRLEEETYPRPWTLLSRRQLHLDTLCFCWGKISLHYLLTMQLSNKAKWGKHLTYSVQDLEQTRFIVFLTLSLMLSLLQMAWSYACWWKGKRLWQHVKQTLADMIYKKNSYPKMASTWQYS